MSDQPVNERQAVSNYMQCNAKAILALKNYEENGGGLFLWQAYRHAREARRYFSTFSEYWKREYPDSPCHSEYGLIEKVLAHLDVMLGSLEDVNAVGGHSGSGALRAALQVSGRRAPINSHAMATRNEIIMAIRGHYGRIDHWQVKKIAGAVNCPPLPTAVKNKAFKEIAAKFNVSLSQVNTVWTEWLSSLPSDEREYEENLIEMCKTREKQIAGKVATDTLGQVGTPRPRSRRREKPKSWK